MDNKKSNFIVKALILGIPVATALIPSLKSEAMFKNIANGVLRNARPLTKVNLSSTKVSTPSNIKVTNLTTSSAVRPTTSSNPIKTTTNVQSLIQGLNNKGNSGTSSSSNPTKPLASTGKLNLSSVFASKLEGILGSGKPTTGIDKTKIKPTSTTNVKKLDASVSSGLGSVFGNSKVSSTPNSESQPAYVNPSAPAPPPLTSTSPTTGNQTSKIPDAPPLPTTLSSKPLTQGVKPVVKKSSSVNTNGTKTLVRPSTTPTGYENMLSELKAKISKN